MAIKLSVTKVLDDSGKVEQVWDENDAFTLNDVTRADFKALRAQVVAENQQMDDLRRQLDALSNSCGGKAKLLAGQTTRARSAIKGYFGPDSTEYEQSGGTRSSDRKPATRKPKTP